MCRLLGWVSQSDLTLREILGEESFVAFAQLSRIHADGWGLAYVEGDGIGVRRSITCAATDPQFYEAADGIKAPAAVAHLRWASPGLPVVQANAHPFHRGQTAFAHNGLIKPFDRLHHLLPEPWRARLAGTTDSENYFLAALAKAKRTGSDLPAALTSVVRRLVEEYTASSLNAMLLTPAALYVVNCHDPSMLPVVHSGEPITVDSEIRVTEEEVIYFGLRCRRSSQSVVVASSGFGQPEGVGWQQIEGNSLLVVDRATLAVDSIALDVRMTGAGANRCGP